MPKISKNIPFEIIELGKYLKQLRKELGLSIRGVAKECRISPSHLAKIETANFKTVGIKLLVKLSEFYNIPVSAILKETGFIEIDDNNLPELAQYLRAKYQLSPQAIRDMEMAKEIVEKKYPKQ